MDPSTCNPSIIPSIRANPNTTPNILYICFIAVLDISPALLVISKKAEKESITRDNAAALLTAESESTRVSPAISSPSIATIPTIVYRVLIISFEVFAYLVTNIIKENTPITAVRAPVALAKADGSILESKNIAKVSTPITTINEIRTPFISLLSLARCVAAISPAKQASIMLIAVRDLLSSSGSNLLNKYITNVTTSNAPDIIKSIAPALAAFCPANFDTAITAINNSSSLVTNLKPRSN